MQCRAFQAPWFPTVERVTQQRRTQVREPGADLVTTTATEQFDLDEASIAIVVERPPGTPTSIAFGTGGSRGHLLRSLVATGEEEVEAPVIGDVTIDESHVVLPDRFLAVV